MDSEDSEYIIKLGSAWKALGYSPLEKLKLLAKYTEKGDDLSRAALAVSSWQQCVKATAIYDNRYYDLKQFLSYEDVDDIRFLTDLQRFKGDVTAAEENLISISSAMKTTYEDTLLIRNKEVGLLVMKRRKTINRMIENFGIIQESNSSLSFKT